MKKILALMMAGVLFVSCSVCVFANEGGNSDSSSEASSEEGALSPKAENAKLKAELEQLTKKFESLEEDYKDLKQTNKTQQAQISALINAVTASNSNKASTPKKTQSGGGSTDSNTIRNQMLINNNAVQYGNNFVGQGGHVEINGGKSNVTFIVSAPDSGTVTSANSLAASLGGSLINCVAVTSTVAFSTAKVNFYVTGVNIGDNVAVYQLQSGKWVQLPTAEIRKDHVVVNMTRYGILAFIRVPVLASVTY
jgi:hypothetical protein